MAIALVDSDATGFGITNTGFIYNFPGGAAGATDWDFIGVNSDALVSTPAGWTLLNSQVNDQGSYLFGRQGVGGTSVTLVTPSGAGPFNANLAWSRWSGGSTIDVSTGAQATGLGTTTPAVNTGVLASTGEAVIVYAALHAFVTPPTLPVWSSGYINLELTNQGTGGTSAAGILGYKLNAGTAAETPSVTWTNQVTDRYVLLTTLQAAAADAISPNSVTDTITLGAPTVADTSMEISPDGLTVHVGLGAPAVSGAPAPGRLDPLVELYTQALSCLCAAVNQQPNPPQHCAPRVGTEVVQDLGQYSDLCCEGLAYIMLGDTFLSTGSFPDQDIVLQIRGACAPPTWGQELRLGIVRCISAGGLNGEPPTDDVWTEEAVQNLYDDQSLRQASCCIRNWVKSNQGQYTGMDVVIGRQVQGNPQGGCVERYVTITVQFPNLDCICL